MTEQLRPCPFCGGINVIHSGYRMYCHACGAEGPDADSDDESAAIAAWNRRAQPAQAGAEPVAFLQFLTDVVTAAGLLSHGKTDKVLAARISTFAIHLRVATQPTNPTRVPLTDEEIEDVWNFLVAKYIEDVDHAYWSRCDFEFARAIEAAHGIGGGK